ncbi:hypothetical protein [Shewanella inventionis]|uniref:Abi-like protein n=1 Tax=Shewanella inventionis TaxID=1738770 RepID=A0ABQ1J5C9_9GAMM|nr:hypothetical protein [Shewanella inventionis]MCL1157579.1 hypothetical protein [Shewanella inventionis]GGB59125.1 hypothetical protein GCM10011607_19700 [Shewanella inventionis]
MKSKNECLAKLNYLRETFWFSLGAYGLATKEPTAGVIAQHKIELAGNQIYVLAENEKGPEFWLKYSVGFSEALSDGSAKTFVRQTFLMMLLESFEASKKYAQANGQLDSFKKQEWYPFARHLRNAIGHNEVWSIGNNPKDLPTTFRNKTIDVSLDGQPLGEFIDWVYGLQLHANFTNWVHLESTER